MITNPADATASTRTAERARESRGTSSSDAVLGLVRELVSGRGISRVIVDMGCGTGRLHDVLGDCFTRYIGVDVVRHEGFPDALDAEFIALDLERSDGALPSSIADVVCCVETIEHLENPRMLARQLDGLVKPGGLIIITTPNQLSALSKLCLVSRNEFVHFQEGPGLYPAHLSALLECDLIRIAQEVGWRNIMVQYSGEGRMPGTAGHWPSWMSARTGWKGRAFSDNVVMSAIKPQAGQVVTPGRSSL